MVDSHGRWMLTPYMDEIRAGKLVSRKCSARAPSDYFVAINLPGDACGSCVVTPAVHEDRHLHGSFPIMKRSSSLATIERDTWYFDLHFLCAVNRLGPNTHIPGVFSIIEFEEGSKYVLRTHHPLEQSLKLKGYRSCSPMILASLNL